MKQILSKVASAFLIVATASSCYNLAPDNNAGALTSAEIYSGVGNVLNIDSLIEYVKATKTENKHLISASGDIQVRYSYDGMHHKQVNIQCDDKQNRLVLDNIMNTCKSLACLVDTPNSNMWEYHHDGRDSVQYSIALGKVPQGGKLRMANNGNSVLYEGTPEIVQFFYYGVSDSLAAIRRDMGGHSNFSYFFTPDSVRSDIHELLDKKAFAQCVKSILRQKGIESRDIYIRHDADCPVKVSWDNMIYTREHKPTPSRSETKGIIYTLHSKAQMLDVLRQLSTTIWSYLDRHPYVFYDFTPDVYVPDERRFSSMETYFTMYQYTPLYEEYTILVHHCKQTYHILLLDVTGDLWLPNEWVLMKSWKNGEATYDKQAQASAEQLTGPKIMTRNDRLVNPVWEDSSIVNKKK